MAESLTNAQRTEGLIEALERGRQSIARDTAEFKDRINPGKRLNENIQRHAAVWIGGALFSGFLLAKTVTILAHRPKKTDSVKEKGKKFALLPLLFGLFRIALPFIKPALTQMISDQASKLAQDLQIEPPPSE